jgi:predicted acyltransferase
MEKRVERKRIGMVEDPDTAAPKRLMSLDALRGFDMFWIVGGGAVISALSSAGDNALLNWLRTQLTHVDWDGFRFYDLIFPLFIFISGVSTVFSLSKARETGGTRAAAKRVLWRTLFLFLLGVIYSGGISRGWDDIRWMGVLQRIALAYGAAGLLYLFLSSRALVGVWIGILLGYWALMAWVPIRDIALDAEPMQQRLEAEAEANTDAMTLYQGTTGRIRGVYDPGRNVANHLDFKFLPGKKWDVYWDPEGLLSTIPAVATALLGIFAAGILRHEDWSPHTRMGLMALFGFGCLVLGSIWDFKFPVIKKVWTSSYVLVAGGYSLLFLSAFYYVVDIRRLRRWCMPFVWIGTNALTVYLAANILNPSGGFRAIGARLVGGPVKDMFGAHGNAVVALGGLMVMFWLARFLYKRSIFIRI